MTKLTKKPKSEVTLSLISNSKYEQNFEKLKNIYFEKSKKNDEILKELCNNLARNGKVNLATKLKELKTMLDGESYMKSKSMYQSLIVVDSEEHKQYLENVGKYIREFDVENMSIERSKYGDCAAYAMDVYKMLVLKNKKLEDQNSKECFLKTFL